jgi:hypothetical protein
VVFENNIVSERLENYTRKVFAQYGGGMPGYDQNAPGGLQLGQQPGGFGGGRQVNQYYETPLDESMKRLNDPSMHDSTDNIEARHSVYHRNYEEDMKGYLLDMDELTDLDEEDVRVRFEKIMSNPPQEKNESYQKEYKPIEELLDALRDNDDSHPNEDQVVVSESEKELIRLAQMYTNRGTGGTVFRPIFKNDRAPYDLRYKTQFDGNARKYDGLHGDHTGTTGKEVERYLNNPKDHNFHGLHGETLTFDWPQEREDPSKKGYTTNQFIQKILNEAKAKGSDDYEEAKRVLQPLLRLPDGPGKIRALSDFLGDGIKDDPNLPAETMGVADKYPSPFGQLLGHIPHQGY